IPGYKEANFGWPSKEVLKKLWLDDRPEVIYVATEGPLGWYAIKEGNAQGIPVISGFHTNFHSYSQHYNLGFMEKLVKRYLVALHNNSKTTIVPTHEQKLKIEAMGVHDVAVMGRGVDTRFFSPEKRNQALRMQWGVKCNDTVMIYVGRIAEEKNIELTIQSYFLLLKIDPAIKFVLVGDGPLKTKLRKKYPEFIFAGMKTGEALAQYYASADIFIFSSITETFGNVILEAMASGLGVIAYDYAAGRLHITSGENGFLARFNDSDEFLHKIKSLVNNAVLLKKIQINARKHALQNNWPAVVEQFENILYSFCAGYLVGRRQDEITLDKDQYIESKYM
ncbi:MAG: glycosyltransferase family 4 protein, partial [Thiohalomonadales bacterium]